MKKFFTAFIALFHFFYLYASPIATLSIGDIILILFVIVLGVDSLKRKRLTVSKVGCLICGYILFDCLLFVLMNSQSDATSILLPMGRILLYYLTVALFCKDYFIPEYGLKVYKWAAIASTVFLFIQMICINFFGTYISGAIPGLPLLNQQLGQFNELMSAGHVGRRARSFFSEPSYYAIFVLLYLAIDLLSLKKHDVKTDMLLTIGLLLSASGTGILVAGALYLVFFIRNFRSFSKKTIATTMMVLVVAIIGVALFTRTSSFQTFYERTFTDGYSTDGRFGSYDDVFLNDNDSFATKMFGRGVEKTTTTYIAGVPRIYYYFGYVGLILIAIIYLYCFRKMNSTNRAVLFLLLLLPFGTEMIFSYMMLPYGAFLVIKLNQENDVVEDKS